MFVVNSYQGTWIKVERVREQQTLDLHMGVPYETVTLTSFGKNKNLYFDILEEGKVGLNISIYFMLLL